ncbi:putative reverse transcriptase domain-containing protein [Tanacetum coccineum]|uniref:Reverse transcriptase domain-containing protein n=1 Tax=Tanacetum coccineum TaxID=301880 RepID=A0ABQ5EGZ3_9ASTR
MAETMEQYMSKTRADYGSGVARPKIEEKDSFELKGQFLKELRENTFSGSDNEDANEHIEKVLEIIDLFHVPNITVDQLMLRIFPISLTRAQEPDETLYQSWERFKELLMKCPQHYLTEMQELQMLKRPSKKWQNTLKNGIMEYLEEENSTLLYKSRQTTIPFPGLLDYHYCKEEEGNYGPKFVEAYGASHINDTIPRKEKDPGSFTLPCYINNVCFDNALVDLGASVNVMSLLTYLNLGLGELAHTKLTVELADRTVKYPKEIAKNILVGIGKFTFPVDFIILDMPENIKVPLILGRPFLSTARAKIDVYKRKITLRVGEEKIVFLSVKPASSLIKRVYMLSLRERMELDLEARLIGETLVLNRSLDPFLEDYIELNDLNEPFELRRNQSDNLMPAIEEGEVIEEFRTRDDELDTRIDDYPSYYDSHKKIHIDCAHNLNLEDMDAYRDDGMGDVIFGEPFLREVGIKTKRFEGIITLYKSNEVTYQMVRSHLRFKRHTNEQCNKISPLLKVSEKDEKNGISHAYQKLKGFYKGVLNLGPDYIRNAKTEEWLTCGHISVHEME